MFFLTELPIVEGSGTDLVTLAVLLLGGGAFTFDRFRPKNRNNRDNPGSHEALDAIKTSITTQGDRTRDQMHKRMDRMEDKMDTGVDRIVEAINRK